MSWDSFAADLWWYRMAKPELRVWPNTRAAADSLVCGVVRRSVDLLYACASSRAAIVLPAPGGVASRGFLLSCFASCCFFLILLPDIRRPAVNLRESPTHEGGTLCLRELVRKSERLHALLV